MHIIEQLPYQADKSSYWMFFIRKSVQKEFVIFTAITYVEVSWEEFEIKLQTVRPVTLLKRDSYIYMFSCEYCKISNSTCFEGHLRTTASENKRFGKAIGHNDHCISV